MDEVNISTLIDEREPRMVTREMARTTIGRRSLAEFCGTGMLVAAIIGSGIAASRLSPSQPGLELLENAAATGAALVAIILALAPVSGAHLNPVITLLERSWRRLSTGEAAAYIGAQVAGAAVGAILADLMFGLPLVRLSTRARDGGGLWLGEVVATFGLCLVVFAVSRGPHANMIAFAVGAYISAAYFFTSSTSFANPAVTIARMLSNTFAGIRPESVPLFIGAQLVGGGVARAAIGVLYPTDRSGVLHHVETTRSASGLTEEGVKA